jgi:hypothetical protein
MTLYFLLLDAEGFHRRLRPALAAAWRLRSFEPCRPLCADLVPAARAFRERYHTGPEEALVCRVAAGLPFDRDFWRFLAGEVLWLSAAEIPELETTPDALCRLLGADRTLDLAGDRDRLAPIQQVYFGARDVVFGTAFYLPGQAGLNDSADVARLADFLAALDPRPWTPDDLADLPGLADAADRAEELELVREWLPPLQDLYRKAQRQGQVMICERVAL